jgi:hypothetical protein
MVTVVSEVVDWLLVMQVRFADRCLEMAAHHYRSLNGDGRDGQRADMPSHMRVSAMAIAGLPMEAGRRHGLPL